MKWPAQSRPVMNILFFQYGNYAEAYRRLQAGEPEVYRDQKKSVDYVASLSQRASVTTFAICDEAHDVRLGAKLRSLGLPRDELDRAKIGELFTEVSPNLVICRTPYYEVLRQARTRRIRTLPCFADIFENASPRAFLRNVMLRRVLGMDLCPCVANHSLNASQSVASSLHVSLDRIVPWDWSRVSGITSPKSMMVDARVPTALFVGVLSAEKGIGDCLEAAKYLHTRGITLQMSFAGPGDAEPWRQLSERLGIAPFVRFLGLIPNSEVRQQMRAHDIIVVPSRHSYSEGLPNTIYEALASRSALIISDHPAFRGRLRPDLDCLVFEAAKARSLANCIDRLCADRILYATLSANSLNALDSLYIGLEWSELVELFLNDSRNSTGWVEKHSLKTLRGG